MTTTEETTVGQLAELVENYYGLMKRIDKLEKTKEMTKKAILDAFALTGMTTFTTPSGLIASTYSTVYENVFNDCHTNRLGETIVHLQVSRSGASITA